MIEFKNVSKIYDGSFHALENLDLQISDGEFVFVVGPSESGKSSIFRLLTRMEKPTAGSVTIGNLDLGKMKRKKVPYYRRKLGIIFQDPRLFSDQTVFENIALALRVVGEASADVRVKSLTALKMVELADVAKKTPNQLSAFDQQRVALARALAGGAGIIIADEPTGNLDPVQAKEFIELLMRIHSRFRKTVLVFTNGKEFAEEFGQRILFLSHGVVEEDRAAVSPLITEIEEAEASEELPESESEYAHLPYQPESEEATMVFTAVDPAAPAIVETDTVQFDAVKLASQETVQFDAVSAVTEDTVQFKAVSLVSQDTVQFDAASANQDTIQFQAVSAPSEDVSMENTVVNLPIVSLADENEQNGEAIEVEESEPSSEETEMPNDVVEETEDLEQTTTFDAVSATENDLLSAVMKILETTPQENSSAHHRVFSDLTVSDDWSNHGNADEDNVGLIERNHAAGQTTEEDKR